MLPTRAPFQNKRSSQNESEGLEKIFQGNGKEEKVGIAIQNGLLDKIDFKTRAIKRDPEGHFITVKEKFHQKDINIVNIHAPNRGAYKHIRKILEDFKKDTDTNTITLGDFNTPLSTMDRSFKKNQQRYCSNEQCPLNNCPKNKRT